ncbi:MAG: hypothetical protein ACJ8D8_05590 [Microvirga sp.]|jgi:hypothetical protein
MITRYTPPFRTTTLPQWCGACAAVAGGGPNRATAIVVARLVFTISGPSRACDGFGRHAAHGRRRPPYALGLNHTGGRIQPQCPGIDLTDLLRTGRRKELARS